MLDTLLYVLKDGLLRLTNVRKLQCAKKCGTYFMALAVLFSFYGGGGGGGGKGSLQRLIVDIIRLLGRQTFNCVHYCSTGKHTIKSQD